MKLLLDECIDRKLAKEFVGYEVKTVPQMGWAGIKNGQLLALAEVEFDVFITVDRNLSSPNKKAIALFPRSRAIAPSPTRRLWHKTTKPACLIASQAEPGTESKP